MGNIRQAVDEGSYDGVSPDVINLLENAVPIGLDRSGQAAVPENYSPSDGVAVLMRHVGEASLFGYRELAKASMKSLTEMTEFDYRPVNRTSKNYNSSWIGKYQDYLVPTWALKNNSGTESLTAIPVCMVIDPHSTNAQTSAAVAAHETDHWLNYLNMPDYLVGDPNFAAFNSEQRTIMERSGYGTGYIVELHQIPEVVDGMVDKLVDLFQGIAADKAHTIKNTVIEVSKLEKLTRYTNVS